MLKRSDIGKNLASFRRRPIALKDLKPAAVAIILSPVHNTYTYVLTHRAHSLNRNAGNFALPGGRIDPGDANAIAAAIRETEEETGIVLTEKDMVGALDDFVTLTGYRVTPVIFWLSYPVSPTPNLDEVNQIWQVPLAELDDPHALRMHPQKDDGEAILQLCIRGHWINPPTAAWLYQFLEVGLRGNDVRVNDLRQPGWTAF